MVYSESPWKGLFRHVWAMGEVRGRQKKLFLCAAGALSFRPPGRDPCGRRCFTKPYVVQRCHWRISAEKNGRVTNLFAHTFIVTKCITCWSLGPKIGMDQWTGVDFWGDLNFCGRGRRHSVLPGSPAPAVKLFRLKLVFSGGFGGFAWRRDFFRIFQYFSQI